MEQQIIQIGNSAGVIIPRALRQEMGLTIGETVTIQAVDADSFVMKRVRKSKAKGSKAAAQKEFKEWLKIFMKENGELLDELAVR